MWSPDHPRSRGEYTGAACQQHECRGSSPLSRGIRFPGDPGQGAFRIIPALAGNTHLPRSQSHRHPDHPRSRGEYVRRRAWSRGVRGSSPLSRGIQYRHGHQLLLQRIIPALAGNTQESPFSWLHRSDHPRSRGEYGEREAVSCIGLGSSPLSRGIPFLGSNNSINKRIIPALAGNTPAPPVVASTIADHPRSRGEYYQMATEEHQAKGSSPLSRGIRGPGEGELRLPGIIPALAGNTRRSGRRRSPRSDHPRSRGEYRLLEPPARVQEGSSPLSRGILGHHPAPWRFPRIIPALAGNTSSHRRRRTARADHPRSRGEYGRQVCEQGAKFGSSPLSRGILTGGGPGIPRRRIIPALAGNTGG